MTETTETQDLKLKLVASTLVWTNAGTEDMPLWRATGGKEYIVARFDYEPTLSDVGKIMEGKRHLVENHYPTLHETLAGWQLYIDDSLTHNEFLQYHLTESIDFPATDLTVVDATEEMAGIVEQ